jgi:hypothetical protein
MEPNNDQPQTWQSRDQTITCHPCIVSAFVPVPMTEDPALKQQTIDALQAYKEGLGILRVLPVSGQRA